MVQEPGHLSDEEILLVLDGESEHSAGRAVDAHLAACWVCRSRMGELETTIRDFVAHHRRNLDPQLTDRRGPAALLRARLSEASSVTGSRGPFFWRLRVFSYGAARAVALTCATVLLLVLGGRLLSRQAMLPTSAVIATPPPTVPDHRLTPGATRPVTLRDVCAMRHEDVVRNVSDELRRRVFEEYGITHPHAEDYEVDYLIAPGLGGTDDIQNLWPEPSTPAAWNAHRKDVLEERLHQLVCGGELDIATAQQAIATDWISAYEKYCPEEAAVRVRKTRRTHKASTT